MAFASNINRLWPCAINCDSFGLQPPPLWPLGAQSIAIANQFARYPPGDFATLNITPSSPELLTTDCAVLLERSSPQNPLSSRSSSYQIISRSWNPARKSLSCNSSPRNCWISDQNPKKNKSILGQLPRIKHAEPENPTSQITIASPNNVHWRSTAISIPSPAPFNCSLHPIRHLGHLIRSILCGSREPRLFPRAPLDTTSTGPLESSCCLWSISLVEIMTFVALPLV